MENAICFFDQRDLQTVQEEIIHKLHKENKATKNELICLLKHMTDEAGGLLFRLASDTRDRIYGKRVFMRGLIEFSNICSCNCKYCGLRASNAYVERYRLMKREMLECCEEGYRLGYRTFVLQSGEDPWYTVERMADIVSSIKESFPDAAITLSIGERSRAEYEAMFKAGADRYLLRHETASKRLYDELHPGMSFHRRRKCLEDLKEIGYQVGAGFMTGLPGQTEEDLAEDLLYLKELNPHMIGIGPFIPHGGTPLKAEKGGTVEETLVLLAITRLMIPDALMPATTAMGTLHPRGRELALKAGANVVMPNLTPVKERPKYALYENKICLGDEAAHCRKCIERRINSAGLEVDMGIGDSLRTVKKRSVLV